MSDETSETYTQSKATMIKNLLLGAIVPLALVAVGVGVMIGMKRPDPAKKPPVPNRPGALLAQILAADVQTVHSLSEVAETLDIRVNGTVVPFREIQLAAEVSGRIIEKNANTRSGNFVQQGDVLYRIDPRDYELEVERLQRKLDQERATLVEQQQDIENARLLLDVAQQEMQLAEAEVTRMERLQGGFRSEAELDAAKRSRLASMNQRVTIQNQLNLLQARRSRLELQTKLAETELDKLQPDQLIIPGMPTQAFIRTGEHTPLAYILAPLTRYFGSALRDEI